MDPDLVALRKKREAEGLQSLVETHQALRPLCEALSRAGLPPDLDALPSYGPRGAPAIPILVEFLRSTTNPAAIKAIVRALSVPWARPIAQLPLIDAFAAHPGEEFDGLRWAVGNALDVVSDDAIFDEIVGLATNAEFGRSRQMVVLSLKNMKRPDAIPVLRSLLEDDAVSGHAIMALGRLKAKVARAEIETFLTHERPWVRTEAKKALKKIDR